MESGKKTFASQEAGQSKDEKDQKGVSRKGPHLKAEDGMDGQIQAGKSLRFARVQSDSETK